MINIKITTFTNPFSFFCVSENVVNEDYEPLENTDAVTSGATMKNFMSDVNHGHYVLVMWKNKWNRGVIDLEKQFLIWLIDYGIFIRPNEKTVFIDLPLEYKKYPTKVFEASIHGVVPLDKTVNEDCEISNKKTTQWNPGTVEKAQNLIKYATRIFFQPIAILTTKYNDIVLGDLILELPEVGGVNIIDELEMWPVFLEQNRDAYLKDLPLYYISRRHHRACHLKPCFPSYNLPSITLQNADAEYIKIVTSLQNKSKETLNSFSCDEAEGSISTAMHNTDDSAFKITASDIEKYSQRYIVINDQKYNVLNVLVNKARDLRICEQYKDLKSVGRGYSFRQRNFM